MSKADDLIIGGFRHDRLGRPIWRRRPEDAALESDEVRAGIGVRDGEGYFTFVEKDVSPYSATDFAGIDRNGVSNSASAFAVALSTSAGAALVVPSGTYRLDAGLTVPPVGLVLHLDDAILDFRNLPTGTAIKADGTLGTVINVNAVAPGATQITGAAGIEADLSPGDQIKLWSADVYDPGWTNATEGERLIVLSTASGAITLTKAVEGIYSTSPKFAKVTPCPLTIHGAGLLLLPGAGGAHRGMVANYAQLLTTGVLEIQGAENVGLHVYDSDYDIARLDASNCTSSAVGYGFAPSSTSSGIIRGGRFRRCRHWTSTVGGSATGGVGRDQVFENLVGELTVSNGDGFDAHAMVERVTYRNCKGSGASNLTFNIECPWATIEGCESDRSIDDALMFHNVVATRQARYIARTNTFRGSTEYGIQYAAAALGVPAPRVLDIASNVLTDCQRGATYVDPGAVHRLHGAIMADNDAFACGATGSRVFWMAHGDDCINGPNRSYKTPPAVIGSRGLDLVGGKFDFFTSFNGAGTSKGGFLESSHSLLVLPHARGATGAGCEGFEASADCTGLLIPSIEGVLGADYPVRLNGGTGHRVRWGNDGVQIHNLDANAALAAWQPSLLLWTAPITITRNVSLSSAQAQVGMRFRIVRTAAATGASAVTVSTSLKSLAVSQWCEVTHNGTAWVLTGFGNL